MQTLPCSTSDYHEECVQAGGHCRGIALPYIFPPHHHVTLFSHTIVDSKVVDSKTHCVKHNCGGDCVWAGFACSERLSCPQHLQLVVYSATPESFAFPTSFAWQLPFAHVYCHSQLVPRLSVCSMPVLAVFSLLLS